MGKDQPGTVKTDFGMFETVRKGNLYRTIIQRGLSLDYPYQLSMDCIDMDTGRGYPEYTHSFRSYSAAFRKMQNYFKGENVEWRKI